MKTNLTEDQRNQLEALAEEYARRKRDGEEIEIEAYVEAHPKLAEDIRELFPVVVMLDKAGGKNRLGSSNSGCVDHGNHSEKEIGVGTRLGEYQLIRAIGRGGMGVVYQAEHVVLGNNVAIKLLPNSLGRSKSRERFQREAAAAARMQHIHIVQVFDFGSHGESLYYVMSLVDGWGLDRIIGGPPQKAESRQDCQSSSNGNERIDGATAAVDMHRPPTRWQLSQTMAETVDQSANDAPVDRSGNEDRESTFIDTAKVNPDRTILSSSNGTGHDNLWHWVAGIGIQAADALAYAHSMGVVHRDIKPSNLMIDADNHVYVTDFGLAKVADDASLTGTGDLLGTLRYMPPESFSGNADHRSDVYGLGMTLYELLADQPAFKEVDRGSLISAITTGQITSLRKLVPGIPIDLETIVHKSIDGQAETRYQSAADLRDDLQRFINGQPVKARRPTITYKAAKWIGRNRAVSSLTACIVVMAAIAVVAFSISENRKKFADLQEQLAGEKQQLADERKQSAERIANVFDRFLRGYDQSFKMHETISREDLLDHAAALLDTEFEKDPLVEAKLRMTVGSAYLWDVNTDTILKGEPHLKRAVELLKKHDGDPVEIARALTGLARTRCFAALPSEANPLGLVTELEATKQLLEEALEIHESINQPGLYWAETLEVLAVVTYSLPGGVGESKRLIRQGLAMLEGDQSYEAVKTRALLYGDQARAEVVAGDFEQAELLFRKATEFSKQLDNFLVRYNAYDLGNAQLFNGRFAEGEATFKQYLDVDPHVFWPKVAMAISAQGDWQRVIEWSKKSTSTLDQNSWQGLRARRIQAEYLRLSGDDEKALQMLTEVVQKMKPMFDSESPQQMLEYMQANYSLLRMMLFSEDQQLRAFGAVIVESIRDNLDPTESSSTGPIRRGYAISISQLAKISEADMALAERCIELEVQDRPKGRKWDQNDLELLLAQALVNHAKGDQSAAVSQLKKILDISTGHDHYVSRTKYRELFVWFPTLRIAEDTLVCWLCEDGKPDEAVAIIREAVERRQAIEHPSQHLINFANARLGRLLLKLERKEEAREVLSQLAAETKDGPECFRWLEERVAAYLADAGKL